MTKIKLCGLMRPQDIVEANRLGPDYVGFVFAPKSARMVLPSEAKKLREALDPSIKAVGVFVNEPAYEVAWLLNQGVIDIAQIHGHEDAAYLHCLRNLTDKPVWQAFRIKSREDVERAKRSSADRILLDSGAGTGLSFNWGFIGELQRPYLLAGGLTPGSVGLALKKLSPWGVDVSSGIETDGRKDPEKIAAFVAAVRKEDTR